MKNNFLILLTAAMAIAAPACKKTDTIKDIIHAGARLCPVLKLTSLDTAQGGAPVTRVDIHYNTAGNPVEMLDMSPPNPYRADYHFRYDRYNRLTDFFMNPTSYTLTFFWHTYTYPNKNTVVDSVYGESGALITDPRPDPASFDYAVTHILDDQGRIVRDESLYYGTLYTTNFQYDAAGNLIRSIPGYDNKLNPYLTNEVWRFIYEDYSINNPLTESNFFPPVTITQYNFVGLPKTIRNQYEADLFKYSFPHGMQIVYGCDAPQPELAKQAY